MSRHVGSNTETAIRTGQAIGTTVLILCLAIWLTALANHPEMDRIPFNAMLYFGIVLILCGAYVSIRLCETDLPQLRLSQFPRRVTITVAVFWSLGPVVAMAMMLFLLALHTGT